MWAIGQLIKLVAAKYNDFYVSEFSIQPHLIICGSEAYAYPASDLLAIVYFTVSFHALMKKPLFLPLKACHTSAQHVPQLIFPHDDPLYYY